MESIVSPWKIKAKNEADNVPKKSAITGFIFLIISIITNMGTKNRIGVVLKKFGINSM